MEYTEKVDKFLNKNGRELFDTKTTIDELPILFEITNGMHPDSTSNVTLNMAMLWCKFLNFDWFRPYGNFNKGQILEMISICENDQQVVAIMELLSAKRG